MENYSMMDVKYITKYNKICNMIESLLSELTGATIEIGTDILYQIINKKTIKAPFYRFETEHGNFGFYYYRSPGKITISNKNSNMRNKPINEDIFLIHIDEETLDVTYIRNDETISNIGGVLLQNINEEITKYNEHIDNLVAIAGNESLNSERLEITITTNK